MPFGSASDLRRMQDLGFSYVGGAWKSPSSFEFKNPFAKEKPNVVDTTRPTVDVETIPAITGLDPNELSNATYGKTIPIFVGGKARLGGQIHAGPHFNTNSGGDRLASFIISFAFSANPTGTRDLLEIAFNSKKVWDSTDLFGGDSFDFQFREGTYTQSTITLEATNWGANAVAYRPQILIGFHDLNLSDYNNQIPFVAALIGDTTDGADPDDGITLGNALQQLANSPWVGMSPDTFETDGLDDVIGALIAAQDESFLDLLRKFNRALPHWDITQTDKLRVIARGANVTPDIVLDRSRIIAKDDVSFKRQEPTARSRELEFSTIDKDADYVFVPSTAKRPREPFRVSGSVGKESMALPIVLGANERSGLVAYMKFSEELARKSCSLTATPYAMNIEAGDRVALSELADGIDYEVWRVLESTLGADGAVKLDMQAILRCEIGPHVASTIEYDQFSERADSGLLFENVGIGAAAADRLVVILIGACNTTGFIAPRDVTGVTLDGNPCTVHGQVKNQSTTDGPAHTLAIASIAVPAGVTADIEVTLSGGTADAWVSTHALYGLTSHTPFDLDTFAGGGDPTLTINVPDDGALVAGYQGSHSSPPSNAVTWVGATEDFDEALALDTVQASGAHAAGLSAQTSRTVSATSSNDANESIIVATWQ